MGQQVSLHLRGRCRALLHLYAIVRHNQELTNPNSKRLQSALNDYVDWISVAAARASSRTATDTTQREILFPKPLSVDVLWVHYLHCLHPIDYCADMKRAFGCVLALDGQVDDGGEVRMMMAERWTAMGAACSVDVAGEEGSDGEYPSHRHHHRHRSRHERHGPDDDSPQPSGSRSSSALPSLPRLRPSVDLLAAARTQRPFLEKVAPYLTCSDKFLDHCIKLYIKFLQLGRKTDADLLVPSIPVDIAWRAHVTRPSQYHMQTAELTGGVVPARTFERLPVDTQQLHYRHTLMVWGRSHRSDMLAADRLLVGGRVPAPSLDERDTILRVLVEVSHSRNPKRLKQALKVQMEQMLASVRVQPPASPRHLRTPRPRSMHAGTAVAAQLRRETEGAAAAAAAAAQDEEEVVEHEQRQGPGAVRPVGRRRATSAAAAYDTAPRAAATRPTHTRYHSVDLGSPAPEPLTPRHRSLSGVSAVRPLSAATPVPGAAAVPSHAPRMRTARGEWDAAHDRRAATLFDRAVESDGELSDDTADEAYETSAVDSGGAGARSAPGRVAHPRAAPTTGTAAVPAPPAPPPAPLQRPHRVHSARPVSLAADLSALAALPPVPLRARAHSPHPTARPPTPSALFSGEDPVRPITLRRTLSALETQPTVAAGGDARTDVRPSRLGPRPRGSFSI